METTLQQWGNSVGVRIPKDMLQTLTLEKNAPVCLRIQKNGILITPAPVKKETLTLHHLVRNITKENTHTEAEWGSAQGNEVW
jgi:antitoxin MazE